jgi:hypothetical protein
MRFAHLDAGISQFKTYYNRVKYNIRVASMATQTLSFLRGLEQGGKSIYMTSGAMMRLLLY